MLGAVWDLVQNIGRFGVEYLKRFYSHYSGRVTRNTFEDPKQRVGRIRLKCYDLGRNQEVTYDAFPVGHFAGYNHGIFFVPEVDEYVRVGFDQGQPEYPRWVGGDWPHRDPADDNEDVKSSQQAHPESYVPKVAQGQDHGGPGKDESQFVFTDPFVSKDIKEGDKKSIADFKGRDDMVPAAIDGFGNGDLIPEPETPYNAIYPLNKVIRTKRGLLIEMDDSCTEQDADGRSADEVAKLSDQNPTYRDGRKLQKPVTSHQRIHIWHPTGTFVEIHPDGTLVIRTRVDRHVVIGSPRTVGHDRLHVYGNWDVVTEGHCTMHVKESMHLKVDKNLKIEVGEDFDMVVHKGHHHTTVEEQEVKLEASAADITNIAATGIYERSGNNHHD